LKRAPVKIKGLKKAIWSRFDPARTWKRRFDLIPQGPDFFIRRGPGKGDLIRLQELVGATPPSAQPSWLISQKVFIKFFCKSQFPHKSVNISFIITNMKNEFTNLCRNALLQNDVNTFCEIMADSHRRIVRLPSSEYGTYKTVKAK